VKTNCCEHLNKFELDLRIQGITTQHDGRSWWKPKEPGHWVYFNCFLEPVSLRERFKLPKFVEYASYDGRAAGQEAGFICSKCHSAVMGVHENYASEVVHVR